MIEIPKELTDPLADLGVFLKALGPYRDEVIVIGGMTPVMYRHLETTAPTQNRLLARFDLDITLPHKHSAT